MSQGIVHGFEPVEIEEEDRDRLVHPLGPAKGVLDSVAEHGAVRKAREGVVEGLMAKLFLKFSALGYVAGV